MTDTGALIGMTEFAQDALGELVHVDLPQPGTIVGQNEPFGEVESTKAMFELVSPVSGRVIASNPMIIERPELVSEDLYVAGWLTLIELREPADLDDLLAPSAYVALIQ